MRTSEPEAGSEERTARASTERPRTFGVGPRRVMWFALGAVMFGLPFLSEPGRYVADTRDAVWFSPWSYLSHALSLWQPAPYLGHVQVDGLVFPMGITIGTLRAAGLPVWAAERIWHGLLLFAAAGGTALLMDRLRGRRTALVPAVAGVLYALTPYTFGYGLPTTGAFLPYALLPLLLVVTAWGLPRVSLVAPLLYGLVTLAMGGGNGAPQLYAIATTVAYGLWVVAVERSVDVGRFLRFFGVAALATVALNAYWLVPLAGSDVSNLIAFSEPPRVINVASSFSESIRGVGLWLYYGGDQFGPWVGTVQSFITSPWFVLASFVLPLAAVASAWLVRWRLRLFFLFLFILSVLVMAGTFPVTSPTPFGRFLLWSYQHVPGTEGLRTTYKFGGTLNLSIAVLVAMGLEWGWSRVRAFRPRPRLATRAGLAGALAVAIAAAAYPAWSGHMYRGARSAADIPPYWSAALDAERARQDGFRTFFAPAAPTPVFRWGGLHDGLPETDPSLLAVHPISLPLGSRYGSNLLAAAERPYQEDRRSTNEATVLRYLGVRDVVVQNDIDWQRAHTARPAELQTIVHDASLRQRTTFGNAGENVVAPGRPEPGDVGQTRRERSLPPVQVLTVPNARPVVRVEPDRAVVLSGDGYGIASAAEAGLLEGTPPVRYSGDLTPAELGRLLATHPAIVVTDSNRRRVWSFSALRRNFSATLPAGRDAGARTIGWGLFGQRPETQTAAVYTGVRDVTASGYGSELSEEPEVRPFNAFDGDPHTSWLVGGLGDPVGQSITVSFQGPLTLSNVRLDVPPAGFGRRVRAVRLEFSDGTSVLSRLDEGTNTVRFSARRTASLRVRITAVTDADVDNAVGFDEIRIPGVTARELLRVPVDVFELAGRLPRGSAALAAAPLGYVFDRSRTDAPLAVDEEAGIERRFDVPGDRSFRLRGAGHLDVTAPDDVIDRVVRGFSAVTATSSSRLLDAPGVRASVALDGDEDTAWIPEGAVGEWLEVRFPERRIGHLELLADTSPGRLHISGVRVRFSDGTTVASPVDPFTGLQRIAFRPRVTSSVRIEVTAVVTVPGQAAPIGISEVRIPGVELPPADPDEAAPCFLGPEFTIDGREVPVRLAGTVGDVLAGREVDLSTCSDVPVPLSTGFHDLVARGAVQPDWLSLTSDAPAPAPPAPDPPEVTTVERGPSAFDLEVRGARGPFYVVSGQSYDSRWSASIDGHDLGPAIVVDGYAAGWRVDRAGSYTIEVRFDGQGSYRAALVLSILALAIVLGLLGLRLARRRRA